MGIFLSMLALWHSLLITDELLRNQRLVLISMFSVYLLNITFPDDLRLGRCAESASADTPAAVHQVFPLISFPRSILCQIYSSGVEQCLYTYQWQREKRWYMLYTTLKKAD